MIYTIYVCPEHGHQVMNERACCDRELEPLEVVPRAVADELADEVECRHAGERNRLSAALDKYRKASEGDGRTD